MCKFMYMKSIYDVITKQHIYGETFREIGRKTGNAGDSISRLLNGQYKSLLSRYVKDEKQGFVLVDIDSGEEFHCANKKTFFMLLNEPYDEAVSKYIYSILKGKQKTFSFKGRIFHLKGVEATKACSQHKSQDSQWFKDKREFYAFYKKTSSRLRANLAGALRKRNIRKTNVSCDLFGCSIDFLMGWLENQFQEGMTWENWGREFYNGEKSWHIDHIKPCNTFDLSKPEDQKKCFHYTNLRPLWETENLSRPKDGSDLDEAAT